MNDCELQARSREKINMASDLEEEMQSESESFVDIRELLPRDGPVASTATVPSCRGRVT